MLICSLNTCFWVWDMVPHLCIDIHHMNIIFWRIKSIEIDSIGSHQEIWFITEFRIGCQSAIKLLYIGLHWLWINLIFSSQHCCKINLVRWLTLSTEEDDLKRTGLDACSWLIYNQVAVWNLQLVPLRQLKWAQVANSQIQVLDTVLLVRLELFG